MAGRADLNLSRFVGMSEALAEREPRRQNPERSDASRGVEGSHAPRPSHAFIREHPLPLLRIGPRDARGSAAIVSEWLTANY
jgi:hypothetical protein